MPNNASVPCTAKRFCVNSVYSAHRKAHGSKEPTDVICQRKQKVNGNFFKIY